MSATHHAHSQGIAREETPRERSLGEHIFIWLAWALAAAFWGATTTVFLGIMDSISRGAPAAEGGADFGGVAWLIMDVIGGLVLLGAALAYGSYMYSHRNRRLDPVGEAATAELYDRADRAGGQELAGRPTLAERMDRPL
jgi:hypothetical protein